MTSNVQARARTTVSEAVGWTQHAAWMEKQGRRRHSPASRPAADRRRRWRQFCDAGPMQRCRLLRAHSSRQLVLAWDRSFVQALSRKAKPLSHCCKVLEEWRWKPHLITRALGSLAKRGFRNSAWRVLQVLRRHHLGPNIIHYNAAIHAASSQSYWMMSLGMLGSIHENEACPDVVTWNSVIASLGARWQAGLSLLGRMVERKTRPDVFSLNSVLKTCSDEACWQISLESAKVRRFKSLRNCLA